MVACVPDCGEQGIEQLASVRVDLDPVAFRQERTVAPEECENDVAIPFRFRVGEPVLTFEKSPVLLLEDRPEGGVVFCLEGEQPLPGVVLAEEEVQHEPDQRQEEEHHQPGQGRRRVSPLKEDDDDRKEGVEEVDDARDKRPVHTNNPEHIIPPPASEDHPDEPERHEQEEAGDEDPSQRDEEDRLEFVPA